MTTRIQSTDDGLVESAVDNSTKSIPPPMSTSLLLSSSSESEVDSDSSNSDQDNDLILPNIHSSNSSKHSSIRSGTFATARPNSTPPKSSYATSATVATEGNDAWSQHGSKKGKASGGGENRNLTSMSMRRPGRGLMGRSMPTSRPGSVPPPPRGRPRPPANSKKHRTGPVMSHRLRRPGKKKSLTVNPKLATTNNMHKSSHLLRSPVHDLLKSMNITRIGGSKKQ